MRARGAHCCDVRRESAHLIDVEGAEASEGVLGCRVEVQGEYLQHAEHLALVSQSECVRPLVRHGRTGVVFTSLAHQSHHVASLAHHQLLQLREMSSKPAHMAIR